MMNPLSLLVFIGVLFYNAFVFGINATLNSSILYESLTLFQVIS